MIYYHCGSSDKFNPTMTPFFYFPVHNHEQTCTFPSWMLSHHTYENLNQTTTFHFNAQGTSLTITDKESGVGGNSNGYGPHLTAKKFKCNSVVENEDHVQAKIIMQVNFEW